MTPRRPILGPPDDTDVSHSKRCQFVRRSDDQTLRTGLDDRIFSYSDTGGAYRDRTDDLLNANQALSQLS